MERDDKHNANAVPLPPDEACNADPAHVRPDLEGGEGQVANVARACQEEATMAQDSQGKHVPSNPPPLTQQSIINFLPDEAFLANLPPARHDMGTAGVRVDDRLGEGGGEGAFTGAGVGRGVGASVGADVGAGVGAGEEREIGGGDGTLLVAGEEGREGRRVAGEGEGGGRKE